MGGSDGKTATWADATKANSALESLNNYGKGASSPALQDIMSKYSSGQMSLQDALGAAKNAGVDPTTLSGMTDKLMTDPTTGSKAASDFVQNDSLTSGLFGKGGVQDKAQGQVDTLNSNLDSDRQALMGKDESYGLTPQDLQAYGQASGNIARMYGGAEQNLAQSLSDRGLGAAPSGSAGAEFSGLAGNKNEQLAAAQMQIAQNRINTAKGLAEFRTQADAQRQAQNNSLMEGLGSLGQEAEQNQYGRQLAGADNNYNEMSNNYTQNANDRALSQNINNELFNQQQATKEKSFLGKMGDAATAGLGSTVSNALAAPGNFISSASGSAGKGVGSSLASMMV